jgi:uncharacterized membrane protein HdeD (DUF308 family)
MSWWLSKKAPITGRLNQLLVWGILSIVCGAIVGGASVYLVGARESAVSDPYAFAFASCVFSGLVLIGTGIVVVVATLKLRELLQSQLAKERKELAKKGK